MSETRAYKTYPETWVTFEKLKAMDDAPVDLPYYPTLSDLPIIDDFHQSLADAPLGLNDISVCIDIGISGFLSRSDAMKLYEMAVHGKGDILELGTHKGLSTSILAAGISKRQDGIIEAVDIDPTANIEARETISKLPGAERVNFVIMDATRRLNELIMMNRKFGFVFVDHWHGYEATHDVGLRLDRLLLDGGFVLFHDAINVGNTRPDHPYGVFQAIADTIGLDRRFDFCGNFGCCTLYRFSEGKKPEPSRASPSYVVQKLRNFLKPASMTAEELEAERQMW